MTRNVAETAATRLDPASNRFSHSFRVRYGECDPQGIVFSANYVAYFDHGITELCRGGGERPVPRPCPLRRARLDTESWEKTEIPAWLREGPAPYSDV